jgi:hypothetical protein
MTAQIWDQLAAIGKSAPGAWDELPPLPQGAVYTPALGTVGAAMYTFTADQMRAYAAAAVARERARCSDICDQNASCEGIAQKCAAAIRRG